MYLCPSNPTIENTFNAHSEQLGETHPFPYGSFSKMGFDGKRSSLRLYFHFHWLIDTFVSLFHIQKTSLKNRSDNRDFFSKHLLFKFLAEACAALEFCHSKDLVHRNLIASSLFLHGNDTVKLSSFHLCLKLVKQGKAVGKKVFNQE